MRALRKSFTGASAINQSKLSTVIVKSRDEYDLPQIGEYHGPVPQFVMEKFMHNDRKNLVAMVDGHTSQEITYGEMNNRTYSMAENLRKTMNLQKGDVVAIMSPNNLNYFPCWHGIAMTGAASTTINPLYTKDEVQYQLNLTKAKAIIAHPLCMATAIAAAEGKIPVMSIENNNAAVLEGVPPAPNGTVEDLMCTPLGEIDQESFLHKSAFDDDSLVTIPFSSGTTGRAKGVMLTHKNVTSNILQIHPMEGKYLSAEHSKSGKRGVLLCPLPFFHIYGMVAGMCVPLHAGAKLIYMSAFDLPKYLQLIQDHKVTRGHVVPPIVLALAKHPLVDEYKLSSLETLMSGAAPLGGEVQQTAAKRLNIIVKQAWGMTETSPAGAMVPDDLIGNPQNVDKFLMKMLLVPRTEAKIVDPVSGEDLKSTEEGELLVRGPHVMKGYLDNEEATKNTIRSDGWLHTGDIGRFDEEGWLYITDRSKELIKYKGFQVPPAELEALLLTMPQIKDCVVIPVPDEEAGELPRAYVVPQDGIAVDGEGEESITEQQVLDYVADKVAPYKKLRGGVRFADAVPKSPSGKLLRRIQIQMDREASV